VRPHPFTCPEAEDDEEEVEKDGSIERIRDTSQHLLVFAHSPKCSHISLGS